MVRRMASKRLRCPSSTFSHVGVVESSKSAMKTFAPEFNALMIILRSTGPVISTRRSSRSAGSGAVVHSASRMCAVSGRNSGRSPASRRCWRATRAASSCLRVGLNSRCSVTAKARASGVRMVSYLAAVVAWSSTPEGRVMRMPFVPEAVRDVRLRANSRSFDYGASHFRSG